MPLVLVFSAFFISGLFAAFQDQQEVKVEPGQEATLPCQAATDAVVLLLEWNRADLSSEDYVFFYREDRLYETYQHPSFRGRVRLRGSSPVKAGDASVVLQNASIDDSGTYTCRITAGKAESGEHTESVHAINLTVSDPTEGGTRDEGAGETGGGEDGSAPPVIIVSVCIALILSLVVSLVVSLGVFLGVTVVHRRLKAVPKHRSGKAGSEQEAGGQLMEGH
ncbi:uncharacterized protein [Leuresthes tenuis]|uniref:uncharacterized protein n=1 Tax=Leuresthes tenuis TaxID=355514 RepID=UPI003B50DAE9